MFTDLTNRFGGFRPRRVALLGLIGILLIMPSEGSLAQEPPSDQQIFLPFFGATESVSGTAQLEQGAPDSHTEHEHSSIGHIPESGRFTANDGQAMSWPPQVKYIDDVVWHTDSAEVRASQLDGEEDVTQIASQNPDVKALLGDRFTFINVAPITTKWQSGNSGHKVTYFSYSNNITIEAVVNNGAVDSIDTFVATDYQPPLRQNEVEAAAAIARQYWQDKGVSRVNELRGFTIQTFVTEGDGGYYNSRMTYVSFHVDETSDPELLTWVDLTTETVIRAAIDVEGVQYEQ